MLNRRHEIPGTRNMHLRKFDAFGMPEDVKPVLRVMQKDSRFERDPLHPDFYLAVGGDGAILAVKNRPEIRSKPVLLVHYRRSSLKSLGYNSDVGLKTLRKALDDICGGLYSLQKEQLLKCSINGEEAGVALNDVTVKPSDIASTLLFKTVVSTRRGDMELLAPKCDGVIVATKFGSSAWNLSYGGPVSLDLPLMVITFPGSHIKHEHYVCSLEDKVSVQVFNDSTAILDNTKHPAPGGTVVTVEKAGKFFSFIRTKNTFEELSSKAMRQIEFSLRSAMVKNAH